MVALAVGVHFLVFWRYTGHGFLFCMGCVAELGCCSRVFVVLVVFRLLLQAMSYAVVCFGGPGRLFRIVRPL